ncbi:PadR family transcriptional regulator [soil metagenome]
MSSIRLFILGALELEGEMHGHQLRQLAEKEHIDMWTDITVGGLYGAIKRLAAEGLIEEARIEREGSYPERQVWRITPPGRIALGALRDQGLADVVIKPDPFDLAFARFDLEKADTLHAVLESRVNRLRAMLLDTQTHTQHAAPFLSVGEKYVMNHKIDRLRAEITWHDTLIQNLPEIISDEQSRKER